MKSRAPMEAVAPIAEVEVEPDRSSENWSTTKPLALVAPPIVSVSHHAPEAEEPPLATYSFSVMPPCPLIEYK